MIVTNIYSFDFHAIKQIEYRKQSNLVIFDTIYINHIQFKCRCMYIINIGAHKNSVFADRVMQIQEFKYIYDDLKQQIKQIAPLQSLLRLTQKSIKKLECINLYSISDKRDFDLQLQQQQIMQQIMDLYSDIEAAKQEPEQNLIAQVGTKIERIKTKNIDTFDLLNKQDQLLMQEIDVVQYYIDDEHHQNQIKEEDEYDEEYMKDSSNGNSNANRVSGLKKQIDQISSRIAKINGGRGKWFVSDHNDFVKIYNKCGANDKKIIEEGVKVLGMKNTEIMDHLEIYQNYLQLEKEKKIISEEYKQIKMLEKMEEHDKKEKQRKLADDRNKLKKEKINQENQKKKDLILKFKQKRNQEKLKMIQQQEKKQKQKIVKIPLPPEKKKEILERNQKYIAQKQANYKKTQQKTQETKIGQTALRKNFSREKQGSRNKVSNKKITQGKSLDKNINKQQ